MSRPTLSRRPVSAVLPWLAALALSACAVAPPLSTGQSEAEVRQRLGTPTGQHALPGGQRRLEYATGPMGQVTWMVDLDAQGRVAAWHQALEEGRLHAFMARAPGLPEADVLRTLGRPAERRAAGVAGGDLWSWRYPNNDCLWFQVTLDGGRVRDAGFGIDWMCDAMNDAKAAS